MNNNQINLPQNLLDEYINQVNNTASAFNDLCNTIQATTFELMKFMQFVVNEVFDFVKYVYPSGRVKHLALYSRSDRVRNKNLKRILKSYPKYKNEVKK